MAKKSIERSEIRFLPCSGSQKIAPSPAFQAPSPVGRGKRAAFTLAEVLITLGIIGVVAAMTLPTLVQNYQKNVIETRLKKFYSVMNQAINMSEITNGEKSSWLNRIRENENCNSSDKQETEECLTYFFETYLKPYLKYTKYEYINKAAEGGNKGFIVYFSDGSLVRIKHPWDYYFYPVASSLNKNSQLGKTYFPFQMYGGWDPCNVLKNKGLEPFVQAETGACSGRALYESEYSSTRLIQQNGWKIPEDYPWLK